MLPRLCVLGTMIGVSQLSAFGQVNNLDPDFKSALTAYRSGNFTEASKQLEKLLPLAPMSYEVHELLGLTYAAQAQNAKAIEQMQIAVRLKPDSAEAKSNLATTLVHIGKPEQAKAQYLRALELDPQDYDANRNLAGIYLHSNKISEAIPLLEKAQHARPDAYDNGYDLALAYLLADRLHEARQLVVELSKQRDSGELHNLLGRIDEKEGKFVDAANQFSTAVRMDPTEDNLFIWASELLLHRTYVPAIEVFRDATQRYPNSPRLFIGLGMALYSRGEYEESIRALLAAADLNPHDSRCYLFLSKAFLISPSQAEAVIERFRRYAELEPHSALAQYYYAIALWNGRRVESRDMELQTVEALLKKSIALDGTNPDAHLQLGILYADQHAYEKSLPQYERALALNPNLSDAHFRLGRYYLHSGEKDKAQREFDLFKKLQAQHHAEVDKAKAEVQQFVISTAAGSSTHP